MHRDAAGRLWIGTEQGLACLVGEQIRTWATPYIFDIAPSHGSEARSVDDLALATEDGLVRFDGERLHTVAPGSHLLLPRRGAGACVRQGDVCRFEVDRQTYVRDYRLVRYQRRGLVLGEEDGVPTVIANDGLHRAGEGLWSAPSVVTAAARDREGNIWVGTARDGLFALRPHRVSTLVRAHGLRADNVRSLHEDRHRGLWVAFENGSVSHLPHRGEARQIDCASSVFTLFDDPELGILAGTDRGLARLDGTTCTPRDDEPDIFAIHRTRDGRLVVGTNEGLMAFDGEELVSLVRTAPIRAIHENARGGLWLATNGGGAVYRDTEGTSRRWTTAEGLPSDSVRDVYEDEKGDVWIATEDRGLARLRGDVIRHVDERDGLFDNSLHVILAVEDTFWLSSNRGLFRLHRDALNAVLDGERSDVEVIYLDSADGMRHREANGGFQGAGIQSGSGSLLFATQDGIAVVDPRAMRPTTEIEVRIESLAGRVGTTPIVLAPSERSFGVQYTALALRSPQRTRFRVLLDGYDAWREVGGARSVHFSHVPPGRYTFRVEARSGDGARGEATAVVVVEPFWYETAGFRGLAIVVAVLLAGLAVRARERHQRHQRRKLEDEVADRTSEASRLAEKLTHLERAKADIYADISQELRAPLSLILTPLRNLHQGLYGPVEAAARDPIDIAHANALRLVTLVDQIADVAALDIGNLVLRVSRENLADVACVIAQRFWPLAERRRIEFILSTPPHEVEIFYDVAQIEKALSLVVAQAFQWTPSGGAIEIGLGESRDEVALTVHDTGRGPRPDELRRLFDDIGERGHAERQRRAGHSAVANLGLVLARDLVELHGGRLVIESEPGQGSSVSICLRRGRDHLDNDSILDEAASSPEGPGDQGLLVEAALAQLDVPVPGGRDEAADDRPAVLVVDDSPQFRLLVAELLGERYRVLDASNAAEGLRRVRQQTPDLVLTDIVMPTVDELSGGTPADGVELCQAIKADPDIEWIPVVLMTARASSEAKLEGLRAGADDYLTKPFDFEELAARVDNLINSRHRLARRLVRAETPRPVAHEVDAKGDDGLDLTSIVATIDAHLSDDTFGVDLLARRVGLSRSILYERLTELTQQSAAQLIMERRLQRASDLLDESGVSIGDIADAVGFKSVSHFSQRFKARFGLTPTAWRRR